MGRYDYTLFVSMFAEDWSHDPVQALPPLVAKMWEINLAPGSRPSPSTWTGLLCVLVEELRKQEETGQLVQPVLFVLLVLVSVLLYFAVSLMDPGFILSEDSDLQVINHLNAYISISLRIMKICGWCHDSKKQLSRWLGLSAHCIIFVKAVE